MANHVYQYIEVQGSDVVQEEWANIIAKVEKEHKDPERYTEYYPEYFVEHLGMPEYDESDSYAYYCDNVGAKWATIEEMNEDTMYIVSAWRPCIEFCDHIARHLSHIDPDVKVINRYEDEFYNFVGASIHEKDDYDYYEKDWDTIKEERCKDLDMTLEEYEHEDFEDEDLYEFIEEFKYTAYKELL